MLTRMTSAMPGASPEEEPSPTWVGSTGPWTSPCGRTITTSELALAVAGPARASASTSVRLPESG